RKTGSCYTSVYPSSECLIPVGTDRDPGPTPPLDESDRAGTAAKTGERDSDDSYNRRRRGPKKMGSRNLARHSGWPTALQRSTQSEDCRSDRSSILYD